MYTKKKKRLFGNIVEIDEEPGAAIRPSDIGNIVEECWQARFYDHIVRNEKDLERIRQYIRENPTAWLFGEDEEQ